MKLALTFLICFTAFGLWSSYELAVFVKLAHDQERTRIEAQQSRELLQLCRIRTAQLEACDGAET